MQHSTIAAIATAPGAGGIAIVRLSGPESYEVAAKVFRPANPAKKVADAKGYTAMFGAFVEGEEAFDEGVALFFRAPHSYTGEDVVELLTTPLDLAGYKTAITEALYKGTKRNVESEKDSKNAQVG